MLTGEADPITKDAGDTVMSGSFVVSGAGACHATKVGSEAYHISGRRASKFRLVKFPNCSLASTGFCRFITLLVGAGRPC